MIELSASLIKAILIFIGVPSLIGIIGSYLLLERPDIKSTIIWFMLSFMIGIALLFIFANDMGF